MLDLLLHRPCLELRIDNSSDPDVYCSRDGHDVCDRIQIASVHHCTQRKPPVCTSSGGFSYAERVVRTPASRSEGSYLVKNTARTPAHYKLWAPARTHENGRTFQVGAVSLVQSRDIVSAGLLRETDAGCDTHSCRQFLQVIF